jgi:putative oxidoreductase
MKNMTLSGEMPKRNVIGRFVEVNRKITIEIISALFVLLFLYTSLSKYSDFGGFQTVLVLSPLIGKTLSYPVAWSIISIEVLLSALLLIPRTKLLGFYGSFILMSIFTLYIGYMLSFTSKLPCHCGGVISKMTWPQHLVFNVFFTGLSFIAIRLLKAKKDKDFTKVA